jgi:hypothetical protein
LGQKFWKRPPVVSPPAYKPPEQRKQRRAAAKPAKQRWAGVEKEAYPWVEAMGTVAAELPSTTPVIHVFGFFEPALNFQKSRLSAICKG